MSKLEELVRTMFTVLDTIEMSDEGKEFYPTTLFSCREMDRVKLDRTFGEMRKELGLTMERPRLRTRDEIEPGICPRCHGTGDLTNHERYSNDCYVCDRSGRVKPCTSCDGSGTNKDAVHHEDWTDCKTCNGNGLVADKDW
jgi:hypothetical protein